MTLERVEVGWSDADPELYESLVSQSHTIDELGKANAALSGPVQVSIGRLTSALNALRKDKAWITDEFLVDSICELTAALAESRRIVRESADV